jgi:hypothetical protein
MDYIKKYIIVNNNNNKYLLYNISLIKNKKINENIHFPNINKIIYNIKYKERENDILITQSYNKNMKYYPFIFRKRKNIKNSILSSVKKKNNVNIYNYVVKVINNLKKHEKEECNICMDNKNDIFLRCGHLLCKSCLGNIIRCPFCKEKIFNTTLIKDILYIEYGERINYIINYLRYNDNVILISKYKEVFNVLKNKIKKNNNILFLLYDDLLNQYGLNLNEYESIIIMDNFIENEYIYETILYNVNKISDNNINIIILNNS